MLAIPLVLVEVLFGALVAVSGLAYAAPVSLWGAISASLRGSPFVAFRDLPVEFRWFLVASVAAWAVSVIVLRYTRVRRLTVAIGLIRLGAPLLLVVLEDPVRALALFVTPLVTAQMVGGADGEFYQEWLPCIAAMGWWVLVNAALMPLELFWVRPRAGSCCSGCGYSLRGLQTVEGRVVCPECGRSTAAPRGRAE